MLLDDEQGPYETDKMEAWFKAGYFDQSTLVRVEGDSTYREVGKMPDCPFFALAKPKPQERAQTEDGESDDDDDKTKQKAKSEAAGTTTTTTASSTTSTATAAKPTERKW